MIDETLQEIDDKHEEGEMYENYRVVVDKGQSLLRIDKFLMARIEGASRNKIQNAAKAECILVNDKPVKSSYRVKPHDVISVLLPEPPREIEIIPQDIPLNIVYEDADVIVVNKQANLVVHPGYGNYTGTLLNALTFHFQGATNADGSPVAPYLVHRIDKNTTGLLLIAKNEMAQTYLAKQFYEHTIDRKYNALVWGDFAEDSGTIIGHLGRSTKDRKIMTVYPDGDQGKHAVTHWNVVERFGYVSLVECVLETGRTHQIRAHMRYIGHPLFNDDTYGGNIILKGTTFSKYKQFVNNCFDMLPRQALHAKVLGFVHPTTKEKMYFESELPTDMESVLEKWRKYVVHSNDMA
ncbi:MAG: RluA family pseudouridine synthase [Bacteroidales bacterium]|jgi:23S rRNA pseudouridine1911/1915/1917 synthase|nr:RluA family pseudouridine synthase [Bacteroidales bacterium]